VTGPNGVHDPRIEQNVHALIDSLVPRYDAFQDNPWPIVFKRLDERYPNSKFILTVRDSEPWLRSQIKDFGRAETPMRKWIYGAGAPLGNEARYVARYEAHNAEVLEYFKDRSRDLLVMDLTKGDGWPKLCAFLGAEIPNTPFPHANKGGGQAPILKRIIQRIKRLRAGLR
jgi:hypothetical protein